MNFVNLHCNEFGKKNNNNIDKKIKTISYAT